MNRPRPDKPAGSDAALEDPGFILTALQGVFQAELEFPIKVEGTSTLPYASVIHDLRPAEHCLVLKLVRPLPHELIAGAVFEMVFPVEDQRFETRITFQGREAYLQYRFEMPLVLTYADRRRTRRFPFRPRESAYVIAQDGRIPGLGLAGPLVNISMGGVAMRVDRVLKLDDGMRVPPSTALFERGKGFPQLRIQDLPRLPLLEWRGVVAHATSHGSEVILGIEFAELGEDEARDLRECLEFREKILRGAPQAFRAEGGSASAAAGSGGTEAPAAEVPAEAAPEAPVALASGVGGDPLLRMRRRSARVILCMPPGEARPHILERLGISGYLRVEVVPDLETLKGRLAPGGTVAFLLVDMLLAQGGDVEPLAAVRSLERELSSCGSLPVIMLCEWVDPTLFLALGPQTRILPYAPTAPPEERAWVACLDEMAEI